MQVKLPSGRLVKVGTQFGNERPELVRPLPRAIADEPFRSTRLRITLFDEDGREIGGLSGVSYCNPGDRFEKLEGRKRAMRRLFATNRARKLLSREECRLVSPVLLGQRPKSEPKSEPKPAEA
jgi:hypothetical protein